MLEVVPTKSFKKDLKKYQYKKDMVKELYDVISILTQEKPLDPKNKDHNLVGNYVNYRECHVKNDVLLIYQVDKESNSLYLARFGSHSEVF
ncbi:MAG: type II toxin-antitoxin system YafQ family toxin [Parachlamydiaceae bacterium]|nr:type II toxin-antitoxin system YafQ family toxin [Parachlamydiaceae bacterium]